MAPASRKKPVSKPRKAPKQPKRKTVENDETCLQMHAWQWVTKEFPHLLIFHIANELKAHVSYHIKQKRLGKLPGVADFLAFPDNGRKIAVELKDDKGKQDTEQEIFQKRWEKSGGSYFLVRTLAEFQNVIRSAVMFG